MILKGISAKGIVANEANAIRQSKINKKINEILDIEFSSIIENNQKETKRNLKNFKKKYPSLETFIEDSNIIDDKKIVNEKDIVQSAIDEKSRIEKKFWNQIESSKMKKINFLVILKNVISF